MPGRLLLIMGLLVGGLACTPRPPAGVPAGAVWAGTRKAGAFVVIGEQTLDGWKLKVYDRKGALIAEGPFVLRGLGRTELSPEDFARWDSGVLHLKDGAALVPKR